MTPDPGTDEAQDQGCVCPVLDNRGATPGTFVFDLSCPVHQREKTVDPDLVDYVRAEIEDRWGDIPPEVAEEAVRACLSADSRVRLYTRGEVGDAQAAESAHIARQRDRLIRHLGEENRNLRELVAASTVYEAIVNSGMFVRKDDTP